MRGPRKGIVAKIDTGQPPFKRGLVGETGAINAQDPVMIQTAAVDRMSEMALENLLRLKSQGAVNGLRALAATYASQIGTTAASLLALAVKAERNANRSGTT